MKYFFSIVILTFLSSLSLNAEESCRYNLIEEVLINYPLELNLDSIAEGDLESIPPEIFESVRDIFFLPPVKKFIKKEIRLRKFAQNFRFASSRLSFFESYMDLRSFSVHLPLKILSFIRKIYYSSKEGPRVSNRYLFKRYGITKKDIIIIEKSLKHFGDIKNSYAISLIFFRIALQEKGLRVTSHLREKESYEFYHKFLFVLNQSYSKENVQGLISQIIRDDREFHKEILSKNLKEITFSETEKALRISSVLRLFEHPEIKKHILSSVRILSSKYTHKEILSEFETNPELQSTLNQISKEFKSRSSKLESALFKSFKGYALYSDKALRMKTKDFVKTLIDSKRSKGYSSKDFSVALSIFMGKYFKEDHNESSVSYSDGYLTTFGEKLFGKRKTFHFLLSKQQKEQKPDEHYAYADRGDFPKFSGFLKNYENSLKSPSKIKLEKTRKILDDYIFSILIALTLPVSLATDNAVMLMAPFIGKFLSLIDLYPRLIDRFKGFKENHIFLLSSKSINQLSLSELSDLYSLYDPQKPIYIVKENHLTEIMKFKFYYRDYVDYESRKYEVLTPEVIEKRYKNLKAIKGQIINLNVEKKLKLKPVQKSVEKNL